MAAKKVQSLITSLLKWYAQEARRMPWRYSHFEPPRPYHTWLSEIMLQQTTVATVIDYFQRFIQRWPTLKDLAQADEQEVLSAWQGLGYYSRARNLLKCAQVICKEFNGEFPRDLKTLQHLPGIGPYTAEALRAIVFRGPAIPIDGNIMRVFSRLYDVITPLPALKTEVEEHVKKYAQNPQPGDFAQALMDLGATLCTPKNPTCGACPIQAHCLSYSRGTQEQRPVKGVMALKKTRYGKAFVLRDPEGRLFLRKRPSPGLLAHMMEVPTTQWHDTRQCANDELKALSLTTLKARGTIVKHTFTHFHLELEVFEVSVHHAALFETGQWVSLEELPHVPLPTLMKKVINTQPLSFRV
jgi:A/G-specific adenine glycosylase